MKRIVSGVIVSGLLTGGALSQPVERREVAGHVHGEATMSIAVDGNLMAIDFDAPGVDLVGFEHVPRNAEEQTAVDTAIAALTNAIPGLFDFGAAANCAIVSADVQFLVEGDEAPPLVDPNAPPGAAEEITNHTGFEAVYEIACTNAGAIRELRLGLFEAFPNTSVVEVELATGRGQTAFDVDRGTPTVSLAGLL